MYVERNIEKEQMINPPLLTIAVPTYNGAGTIKNMLDILLPQITNEVEVIISDNCSNDQTANIIKDYEINYSFIKSVRNEKNIGADGNFLQCIRMAKGKFTMLISDDDIITEVGVKRILEFLHNHSEITLAFLHTVGFKDKYIDIEHCHEYKKQMKKIKRDICTFDKKVFFDYVRRQWGFTSSFLWSTERAQKIKNPEQFYGTFWLQSYIHILCSNKKDDLLGIIAGPCVAAGEYGIIGNYDTAEIEAVFFKKMLDFAVGNAKYDEKQLNDYWIWKVCYIGTRSLILEKSAGVKKTNAKLLFSIMKKYPYAWIHLFPAILAPRWLCYIGIKLLRKRQGRTFTSYINRPTSSM